MGEFEQRSEGDARPKAPILEGLILGVVIIIGAGLTGYFWNSQRWLSWVMIVATLAVEAARIWHRQDYVRDMRDWWKHHPNQRPAPMPRVIALYALALLGSGPAVVQGIVQGRVVLTVVGAGIMLSFGFLATRIWIQASRKTGIWAEPGED